MLNSSKFSSSQQPSFLCFTLRHQALTFGSAYQASPTSGIIWTAVIVNTVSIPFTVFANALVILALLRYPHMRSTSNTLVGWLAVADGLCGLVAQPLFVCVTLMYGMTSVTRCVMEELTFSVIRTFYGTSLLHVMLINIERYIAITRPLRYPSIVTKERVTLSVTTSWVVATITSTIFYVESWTSVYINVLSALYLACVCVSVFCCFVVTRKSRQHQRQIAIEHRRLGWSETTCSNFKNVRLWFVGVTFMWVATHALSGLIARKVFSESPYDSTAFIWTCIFTNCWLNPLVIFWKSAKFRAAFREILRCRKETPQQRAVLGRPFFLS
ncbi:predicted protein [Nematostella vectensis]|uniref:G-protein coupled receptors family 1 profile domain-containing protein n=1 Tax=Nematostella vectensis TaxID=45351 RepID=A7SI22_NEMVE|nr:predicted protein [Nematostella vectensis]|eukprot:XP_001628712.1 predicted protein [Nematostella vectensis]